jgi:hypothetical protein
LWQDLAGGGLSALGYRFSKADIDIRDTSPQPSEYDSPRQPEKGICALNQHRLLGGDTRRRAVR